MSALFLKLVNTSISASWFILAALVLRLGLRKAPKWVSVALWGLVAVRLVCPVTLESALSLIPSAQTIPLDIAMDTTPAIQSGVPVINQVVNPAIVGSNTPAPGASVNPLQITVAVLANVWALGAAAMLAYTAVSYIRLRRRVFAAVRLRDHIYQSEAVTSPFVLGLFAPKIYLPFRMEEGDMAHVIAHEQAHIRRRDHWWKPLGFALLSVHWFNPLMWLAYILLCRDIELACDEKVIQALEHDARADYSQALLSCAADRRLIAACPLAFGEVGVKERVKSVLSYKKPAFWLVVLAVAACAAAGVCFLTDPVTPLEAQGRITGYGISADPVSGRESYHVRVEDLELDCTKEQHLDVVTYMGYVREGVIEDGVVYVTYDQFLLSKNRGKLLEIEFSAVPSASASGPTDLGDAVIGSDTFIVPIVTAETKRQYVFEEGEWGRSTVTLYDDGRFDFTFSPVSSYLGHGTYEETNDRLTLHTDDGKFVYTFDVTEEAIIFDGKASSEMLWFSGLYDGAVLTGGAVPISDEAVVEALLHALAAYPDNSAIRQELLDYGDATLLYLSHRFLAGGETGERGELMGQIFVELLDGEAIKYDPRNAQDYFDNWLFSAKNAAYQSGEDFVKERMPKTWLILDDMRYFENPEPVHAGLAIMALTQEEIAKWQTLLPALLDGAGAEGFAPTRGEREGNIVRLYEESHHGTDLLTLRKQGEEWIFVSHQHLEE